MTDEMSTKPTMETLLTRINEWGANLTSELSEIKKGQAELQLTVYDLRKGQDELRQNVDDLRKGQDELRQNVDDLRKGQEDLRKGQDELRADMNSGLHRVKRQIQTMNDTILESQAEIRELNVQIEKLEAESLAAK